jgi:cbb3-type cytochrome oxidase subunit 3
MVIAPWVIYAMLALMVVTMAYSYYAMRKAQKKNQQTANQLDGTIADEGVSFQMLQEVHICMETSPIFGDMQRRISNRKVANENLHV